MEFGGGALHTLHTHSRHRFALAVLECLRDCVRWAGFTAVGTWAFIVECILDIQSLGA